MWAWWHKGTCFVESILTVPRVWLSIAVDRMEGVCNADIWYRHRKTVSCSLYDYYFIFIVSSVFISSVSFLRFVCSYLWAPSNKHWFKLVLFQKERRGEGVGMVSALSIIKFPSRALHMSFCPQPPPPPPPQHPTQYDIHAVDLALKSNTANAETEVPSAESK